MGDSLGAGVGSTSTANRYVNFIYQHELARYPDLQLVNLSCSGATTTICPQRRWVHLHHQLELRSESDRGCRPYIRKVSDFDWFSMG